MNFESFLEHMAVIVSNDPILFLILKIGLFAGLGLTFISGVHGLLLLIGRVVPKEILPFYWFVLFILAPLLLIRPTYWVSSIGVEVPYILFYFLFYVFFMFVFVTVCYFIAIYCKWIKRKPFGHRIIDEYPMGAGTVMLTLCGFLFLIANHLFY